MGGTETEFVTPPPDRVVAIESRVQKRPDQMRVRAAEAGEIDRLAALWHDGWHDAHARIVPAELTRHRTPGSFRERMRADLRNTRVVVPRDEAVGFYILKGDELYQLYVAAGARGSGAAAALIADAEARLAERGVERAWLACAIGNERAARFYDKSGWERSATMAYRTETSSGVFTLDVWRYEKELRAMTGGARTGT